MLLQRTSTEVGYRHGSCKEKMVSCGEATVRGGGSCPLQPEEVVEQSLEWHKEGKREVVVLHLTCLQV